MNIAGDQSHHGQTHMQKQNRTTEKTQSTVLIEENEKKQNRMADGKRATKTQT
ncbi:hypothetical protein FH972_002363 [Carpinus fangiana]|uniref:Uncharacterized protein n=1 Tax=Carpinus fangiana TaxID=176857 RepID=A0A5N6QGH9_9ROSI|nr:hypothetical protein FH972_002363 [Carpinus fangiana]